LSSAGEPTGDSAPILVGGEALYDLVAGGVLAWWTSRGLGAAQLTRHEIVVEAARFGAAVAARTVAQAGASPPRLPATAGRRALHAADRGQ